MSVHVLLNLLNELSKEIKCDGLLTYLLHSLLPSYLLMHHKKTYEHSIFKLLL